MFGTRSERPAGTRVVRWLFLRALGLVYFAAFRSLRSQVLGLYGRRGILPIERTLQETRASTGLTRRELALRAPSVFWWAASDAALIWACRCGEIAAIALACNVAPLPALAALWLLYQSFVSTGREFLLYQWDALLLEVGLSSLLVAPGGLRPKLGPTAPPWPAVWLLRSLAFRLHFQSGLAKLASRDRSWRDLTACRYHFETQPLPTPLGWYAHHAQKKLAKATTAAVLVLECGAPLLTFGPRAARRLGFAALLVLQAAIALTGNFAFFNLLSAAITLWLLDDASLPRALRFDSKRPPRAPGALRLALVGAASAYLALVSAVEHLFLFRKPRPPRALLRMLPPLVASLALTRNLRAVNVYALFSVMTRVRREIVIEGSDDGVNWLEYEFRYKPGEPSARPRWVAPHQPRLDWQMWFAALGAPPLWFGFLLVRLLEGSPDVLALFARVPFPDRPPRYVRALLYEYRMSDPTERRRSGVWWTRTLLGPYFPAVMLPPPAREAPDETRSALALARAPR